MKRPIRYALLLPSIVVPITAISTVWAGRAFWVWASPHTNQPHGRYDLLATILNAIWHGINGPAMPGIVVDGPGVAGHAIYVVAAALLWWVVGRAIDRRRGLFAHPSVTRELIGGVAILLWGLILIAFVGPIAWEYWRGTWEFLRGDSVRIFGSIAYLLQISWAFFLLIVGIVKLRRWYVEHSTVMINR